MDEVMEPTNRLIQEKSPYLLQHAHNPVDWYPWGEEAFTRAEKLDRPIFLSIGYATCHWCHVMEKESFESAEIAALLNKVFVCIKVDREERPDVDTIYMEFAQGMMSGMAGWPLNMLLTPRLLPFFAVTYLPPYTAHGMIGLADLVERVEKAWLGDERQQLVEQAEKNVEIFTGNIHLAGNELPAEEQILLTAKLFYQMTDPVYGGWRGAPKFPLSFQVKFLLGYARSYEDNRSFFLAERSLEMMHRGGIYDHVGGGFHRYSVDERWLIPHFEKMLYDNALLADAYLEAWRYSHRDDDLLICREILDYILRDLSAPCQQGFYSAQDADSEGGEGFFYLWTKSEIMQALGTEDGGQFCQFYGVLEVGNFHGRNVLYNPMSLAEFVQKKGENIGQFRAWLGQQKERLLTFREKREHPFKDDKILTSWNGLAIRSMAEAGAAFQEERYSLAACETAKFLKTHLWDGKCLLHRWRDGEGSFNGGLDDYAFLISGLISLFEIDCGTEWLNWALELCYITEKKFKSPKGAFFQTDGKDAGLILRKCQFSDGSEPSGNAVHCENLIRLYYLTGQTHFLLQAEDILKAVKKFLDSHGPAYSYHAANLMRYFDQKFPTLTIALNSHDEHRDFLFQAIFERSINNRSIIWRREADQHLSNLLPDSRGQVPIDGHTTLYLCRGRSCESSLTDLEKMLQTIGSL